MNSWRIRSIEDYSSAIAITRNLLTIIKTQEGVLTGSPRFRVCSSTVMLMLAYSNHRMYAISIAAMNMFSNARGISILQPMSKSLSIVILG